MAYKISESKKGEYIMLKKDLQELNLALSDQLLDYEAQVKELKRDLKDTIESLNSEREGNKRGSKITNEAINAIEAIMAVNCSDVVAWMEACRQAAMDGTEIPEKPDGGMLCDSLEHIRGILQRTFINPNTRAYNPYEL